MQKPLEVEGKIGSGELQVLGDFASHKPFGSKTHKQAKKLQAYGRREGFKKRAGAGDFHGSIFQQILKCVKGYVLGGFARFHIRVASRASDFMWDRLHMGAVVSNRCALCAPLQSVFVIVPIVCANESSSERQPQRQRR